ncbi:MAG TPA: WXG100 family type VII secretion target [Ktedonobacteraceae bacterium]|nr:WXG100 family type VII secretion target [Ktedonobacteraceae bacterium]
MGVIHVNTDLMRQLGQVFVQLNDQISNQIEPNIQNSTGQLEGDWQGISRQRFEQLIQEWRSATNQVVQVGEDIGRHLQNTAQQFESIDQNS